MKEYTHLHAGGRGPINLEPEIKIKERVEGNQQ